MRFRIEYVSEDADEEIVLRCRSFDENVKRQCEAIEALIEDKPAIVYYRDDQEYYLPSREVLFFETDGETVYAHTSKDMFKVNHRLYQLEEMLPSEFIRISKSAVANTGRILSLNRTLPSTAAIRFFNSNKQVYASKFYLKDLKEKLSHKRR